ncbi:MAG: response regulator [Planctomycetes bacterium]|jgi:CheY-like chemotaxis protein|nr:response regulator [Phycisphaerae bacterium]NBB94402.1 response regulator [Planctomycetota bacterium]
MTDAAPTQGKTILMFDDDPDFLLAQKTRLEAAGFNVVDVDSSDNAEQLIRETKPDVLVVDLMMENEDTGFTLCYAAKKLMPELPVILVTGVASETGIEFDAATKEERSWVKADAVLAKPIRFEQLQADIEHLLTE